MLAKKFRLQIQDLYKPLLPGESRPRQSTKRSGFFVIKIMDNNLAYSRFGVIISKKVSKLATRRNKMKRIIFDFARLRDLHLNPDRDFLITVLPAAINLTKEEIEKDLEKFFKS